MDMPIRDRSEGWRHAKLSGHNNEELVNELLSTDTVFQNRFLNEVGVEDSITISSCQYGGLNEKSIMSALGGKTKAKSDILVCLSNGTKVGVSIKKSLSGQVFLITDNRFVRGMREIYRITVPEDVKRAISLFWGSADDIEYIIRNYSSAKYVSYELEKHRLTADTLKRYNGVLAERLIEWFRENIRIVTDFCFSMGLALSPDDKATIIWYKNMLGERDIDAIFHIDELCKKCEEHKGEICFGTKNGGTTIVLPFGFVQFHQDSMQFHHQYEQIKKLFI